MVRMSKLKKISIISTLLILFIVCLYLAIFAGHNDSGIKLFLKSFSLSNDSDSMILELLRYPRAIKAVVAGSCLALAGLFMQAISKNPLAEPYITGISSGAGLGIVLSILFFKSANYSLFGFLGALISSVVVIMFSGLRKFSITKLILVGLSMNIFVSSLISLIILTNPEKAYVMMFILTGGFSSSDMLSNKMLLIVYLFVLVACVFLIPKLNYLRLDKNLLSASVKETNFYSILIILTSAFLTSLSVFAAGILGFIGIIIPQISKMLVGQDYRYLFVTNILLGSSFILIADYIARTVIYPLQIPLGLVIAFIGSPIFVFFLTKKGNIFND